MASRASTGLMINLDHVPLRDETMTAYDIMLSESQERMLIVAKAADVARIKEIFESFHLACTDIGHVTGDGLVHISYRGRDLVNLSATLIIENAPRYRRSHETLIRETPFSRDLCNEIDLASIISEFKRDRGQTDLSFITDQFDHHIGLNTIVGPNEADASLMRVPQSNKAVAISMTGNSRLIGINSFEGARRCVFSALLEISLQGATPLGITNCLNFGSPENPLVMTDLMQVIDGMSQAAREINVPIISGNVSLYNETDERPILPTLALSLVGLSTTPDRCVRFAHAQADDVVIALGDLPKNFAGCELPFAKKLSPIALGSWDHKTVETMAHIMKDAVKVGIITSACVVGRGGLMHAATKIMNQSKLGITLDFGPEWLSQEIILGLISEDAPMVMVVLKETNLLQLAEICAQRLGITRLGLMTREKFTIRHQDRVLYQEDIHHFLRDFRRGLEEIAADHTALSGRPGT
jgi:phosphoribosylformylglycinamidine synthase